ncbi:MAG: tRNA (adenine(22)-N(1))-methyltransferase [Bacillota bacterium]|nr:SAM-dependent methyltransferase [Clostridia bacterium]
MQVKLSKRLASVAVMVPKGSVVADIGTDHGYLPAYLVMSRISPYVIATDVNKGPLAAAANLISLLAVGKKIDLRLGDGLTVLMPGEVETIVIAGMGASTMIKILDQTPEVLSQAKRLILQPMRNVPRLRTWLAEHQWEIKDEELIWEDEIFYEIVAADHGQSTLTQEEAEIGPILLKKKHPLLKEYLSERIKVLKSIEVSLQNSTKPRTEIQKQDLHEKINTLERVMACL